MVSTAAISHSTSDKETFLYAVGWECVVCCAKLGFTRGVVPCVITSCKTIAHIVCSKCATGLKLCPLCREPCGKILPVGVFIDDQKDPDAAVELARFVQLSEPHPPLNQPEPLQQPDIAIEEYQDAERRIVPPIHLDFGGFPPFPDSSSVCYFEDRGFPPTTVSTSCFYSNPDDHVAFCRDLNARLPSRQPSRQYTIPSSSLNILGTEIMKTAVDELLRQMEVRRYFWRSQDLFCMPFSPENERLLFPVLLEPYTVENFEGLSKTIEHIVENLNQRFEFLHFRPSALRVRDEVGGFRWNQLRIVVQYEPTKYNHYMDDQAKRNGRSRDSMVSLNSKPSTETFDLPWISEFSYPPKIPEELAWM